MFTIYTLPPDFLLKTDDKASHELTTGLVLSREERYKETNLLLPLKTRGSTMELVCNPSSKVILENWPETPLKVDSSTSSPESLTPNLVIVVFMENSCQFLIFDSKDDFEALFEKYKTECTSKIQFYRGYFSCDSATLVKKISSHQMIHKSHDLLETESDYLFHHRSFKHRRSTRNGFFPTQKESPSPAVDSTESTKMDTPELETLPAEKSSSDISTAFLGKSKRQPDPEAVGLLSGNSERACCCLLL